MSGLSLGFPWDLVQFGSLEIYIDIDIHMNYIYIYDKIVNQHRYDIHE